MIYMQIMCQFLLRNWTIFLMMGRLLQMYVKIKKDVKLYSAISSGTQIWTHILTLQGPVPCF